MAGYSLDIDSLRAGAPPTRRAMAKTVLALSTPAILAELSTTLMQYIDAGMVGSLGAHATAAIGVVESTIWLMDGLAMSAAAGFTVQVAQLVGAGRDREARDVFRQGIVVIALFGSLLALVGALVAGRLPVWMGGDPSLYADASGYFLICSLALIPLAMARLGTGMLQCSGDMRTPSILNVLACVLDVSFNAVLIHDGPELQLDALALPIPGLGLGVRGAALGTLLSQLVTAVLMLGFASAAGGCLPVRRWVPHGM